MKWTTIIHPIDHSIIHMTSDVINPINPISRCACMQTKKYAKTFAHIISCILYNRVNRVNSLEGYWIKGGQWVDNAGNTPITKRFALSTGARP